MTGEGELSPEARATENASRSFRLSIIRALGDQLAEELDNDELEPAPLTIEHLKHLEKRRGVYELYLGSERVYVGKTKETLPSRLRQHLRKVSGRTNINMSDVRFACLYVDEDVEAVSEDLLINKYRTLGGVPWNTNGFGGNDPGHERDNTLIEAGHFDEQYPIDRDRLIEGLRPGAQTVLDFLNAVKAKLPFLLRFDTKEAAESEFRNVEIDVPDTSLTTNEIMRRVIGVLPEGWQATALPGYMILYRERVDYQSAHMLWRKEQGVVREIQGRAQVDTDGEVAQQPDEE